MSDATTTATMIQELLPLVAATRSGFWVTPVDLQIAVVAIPTVGLLAGTYIQTRRHPPADIHPDGLAEYAAHRLEELESENEHLRDRVAHLEELETENCQLRGRVARLEEVEFENEHLHERISGLEAQMAELTRRLDGGK